MNVAQTAHFAVDQILTLARPVQPTPDLDSFLKATMAVAGKESVRLNTMSFNDVPEVITMKLDPVYWPSYELRRSGFEWKRLELK